MKNNWISILALAISLLALMLSYRVSPIDFKDYWGFILGVFTLLISLLIGWQIYNVLEIKEYMKKVQEFGDNIPDLYSCIYFIQAFSRVKHEPFSAYKDYIRSLNVALSVKKSTSKEACLKELDNVIDYILKIKDDNKGVLPEEFYKDYNSKKCVIKDCVYELKNNPYYSSVGRRFEEIAHSFNVLINEVDKSETC